MNRKKLKKLMRLNIETVEKVLPGRAGNGLIPAMKTPITAIKKQMCFKNMSKKIFRSSHQFTNSLIHRSFVLLLLATCYSLLATHQVWAGVCKDNYCHGEIGISAYNAENVDPVSTNTATGKCGTCHRAGKFSDSTGQYTSGLTITNITTAPAGGSHFIHTSTTTYNFSCKLCHSATLLDWTTYYTVLRSTFYHVANRATDIKFSTHNLTRPQLALGISSPTYAGINAYDGVYSTSPPDIVYSSCTNLYCHGAINTAYVARRSTPTWGDSTTGDCGTCHGAGQYDLVRNTSPAGGSHRVHTSTLTYNYQCEYCHKITVSSTGVIIGYSTHTNYATNWSLSTNTVIIGGSARYNNSITGAKSPPSVTYSSCTNLYCHSNGRAAGEIVYSTPTWGVALSTTCTGCHKGSRYHVNSSSTISTGKHTAHVDSSTALGTNYRCKTCHNLTIANFTSDIVISSYTIHISTTRNVNFSTNTWPTGSPSAGNWDSASSSCTNVYCHSNGVPRIASDYKVVKWSTGTTQCYDCHGSTTTSEPAPSYTGANAGVVYTSYTNLQANSHGNHSNDCNYCHYQTAVSSTALKSGTTIHTDGGWNEKADIYFDTTTLSAPTVSYTRYGADGKSTSTADNMTCANTGNNCHGANPAQWGGTVGCLDCHGATTDTDDFVVGLATNNFKSYISTGQWYASGHGVSVSSSYWSGNSGAGFGSTCTYCHGATHEDTTNPFRLINSTFSGSATQEQKDGVCLICHKEETDAGYLGKNSDKNVGSAHFGSLHSTSTQGGYFCWDCHDPHGDRVGTAGNVYMIHTDSVTRVSDGNYGYWGSTTPPPAAKVYTVFKSTIAPGQPGGNYDFFADTITPYNGLCNVCHISADHYRYNTGDAHEFATTGGCIGCHSHKAGFAGKCNSCHGYPPSPYDGKTPPYSGGGGRTDGKGKGAHYTNADSTESVHMNIPPSVNAYSTSNNDCQQCHDMSVSTRHKNYEVDVDTGSLNVVIFSTSSYNGYAVYNSTPGSVDWSNRYCLNTACHFGRKSPVWSPSP